MSKLICSSQPLPLCGTRNTRDLGGYPAADGAVTKTHRFLRSDGLAALTQPDIEFLLAYGVGCVVDLRSEKERAEEPSPEALLQQVSCYSFPMLDQAASSGFTKDMPPSMGEVYVELLQYSAQELLKVLKTFAAHSDQTVLFHCSAGKDRTGVVAMLLLLLAGVPREQIIADYSTSQKNMQQIFEQKQQRMLQDHGIVIPDAVFSSAPCEIEKALDFIANTYGTAESYLLHAGAEDALISMLRHRLLT